MCVRVCVRRAWHSCFEMNVVIKFLGKLQQLILLDSSHDKYPNAIEVPKYSFLFMEL